MAKANLRPDLEQPGSRRRLGRLSRDTELRCGRKDQGSVTDRLGSRNQQQAPGFVRERT